MNEGESEQSVLSCLNLNLNLNLNLLVGLCVALSVW